MKSKNYISLSTIKILLSGIVFIFFIIFIFSRFCAMNVNNCFFCSVAKSCPTLWVSSSHQVTKVLELQLQYQSFQWIFRSDILWDWLVWSLYSLRDSQESSPAPQFEDFSSLVLSLLYGPTLTSIHDYWKNHRFDYMDLCHQRDVFTFQYAV